MIPTAEEFLEDSPTYTGFELESIEEGVIQTMIEFAKLHVEAAAKEILENIPCLGSSTDIPSYEEVKDAVLTAYPLTNIK